MNWRAAGYPEFMNVYEREFSSPHEWEQGRLAPVSAVFNNAHRRTVKNAWAACEALRTFLVGVPASVGAADASTFITGVPAGHHETLPETAQEALRRWTGWIHHLYLTALELTQGDHPEADLTGYVAHLQDLVYEDLDPFLVPRLRHWATLRGSRPEG